MTSRSGARPARKICETEMRAMLVLHHAWRSSASRRVRLCLAEKGLEFESHVVDMMTWSTIRPST
jgi:hypothetical protein